MARPAPKPRKYEMMIVVAPTVTEEGLPAVVERIAGLIESQDGAIESFTHDSPWGHRRLAYPIQNFRDAFYVLYYFHTVPQAVRELDRELRLDDAIIRHLIVKYDPLVERDMLSDTDEEPTSDDDDATVADASDQAAATTPEPSEDDSGSQEAPEESPDSDDEAEPDDDSSDAEEAADNDDDSNDDEETADIDSDVSDDEETADIKVADGEDDEADDGEEDEV